MPHRFLSTTFSLHPQKVETATASIVRCVNLYEKAWGLACLSFSAVSCVAESSGLNIFAHLW